MNKIDNLLNENFRSLPRTPEVMSLKEEMRESLEAKYEQLISSGKTEDDSIKVIKEQFGDMEELIEALHLTKNRVIKFPIITWIMTILLTFMLTMLDHQFRFIPKMIPYLDIFPVQFMVFLFTVLVTYKFIFHSNDHTWHWIGVIISGIIAMFYNYLSGGILLFGSVLLLVRTYDRKKMDLKSILHILLTLSFLFMFAWTVFTSIDTYHAYDSMRQAYEIKIDRSLDILVLLLSLVAFILFLTHEYRKTSYSTRRTNTFIFLNLMIGLLGINQLNAIRLVPLSALLYLLSLGLRIKKPSHELSIQTFKRTHVLQLTAIVLFTTLTLFTYYKTIYLFMPYESWKIKEANISWQVATKPMELIISNGEDNRVITDKGTIKRFIELMDMDLYNRNYELNFSDYHYKMELRTISTEGTIVIQEIYILDDIVYLQFGGVYVLPEEFEQRVEELYSSGS